MNFDFNAFMHEWIGKRIADPTLAAIGLPATQWHQCVSFTKQYIRERFHIEPGYWGNAINFWDATNPQLYPFIDRVPTQEVEQGDIVILFGVNGNPDGHIGEATGNKNSSQFELLEQNGATGNGSGLNGDAIRTRWISKSRIAGVLRPKPIADKPYYIVSPPDFVPKQVITTREALKFNLAHATEAAMLGDIIERQPVGLQFKANALLHHNGTGKDYYLQDGANPVGYLVSDCTDYTAPNRTPPAAPLTIPAVTYYELVTTVMTYKSAADAKARNNPKTTTAQGTYIQLKSDEQARQLVKKNMDQDSFWINDYDNRVEVVPEVVKALEMAPVSVVTPEPIEDIQIPIDESWKAPYPLFDDRLPTRLTSTNTTAVKIKSLDGKLPDYIILPPHKELDIVSFFDKGGVRYYRDTKLDGLKRYYALPAMMFPDPYDLPKADENRDGEVTISEFIDYAGRYGTKVFKSGVAVVSAAAKSVKTQKFIDGFRAGSKKGK